MSKEQIKLKLLEIGLKEDKLVPNLYHNNKASVYFTIDCIDIRVIHKFYIIPFSIINNDTFPKIIELIPVE